ncbi:PIR protein, putative [Plasmodium sp.]|nr:PIR protein, putative [Plasmodium sp.]
MKFNYTYILLFSLSLNILLLSLELYNQRNHILTLHNPTTASRLLCECELYAPANYDNDAEMKKLMDDYNLQTSQRFNEYDERMIKNRQKCKEQCNKDIQKIILKDKLEKELTEELSTLQTDICTNDIPTCVCEKSLADKTEKLCLKCGYGLGSNVPLVGLINGVSFYASVLKYAVKCGISAEAKTVASENVNMIIKLLIQRINGLETLEMDLVSIVAKNTTTPLHLAVAVDTAVHNACNKIAVSSFEPAICSNPSVKIPQLYGTAAEVAGEAYKVAEKAGVAAGKAAQGKVWSETFTWETFLSSPLGISIIVTVCIVVMLIIIYLILRYRRKKKMKRKVQYITLLKE